MGMAMMLPSYRQSSNQLSHLEPHKFQLKLGSGNLTGVAERKIFLISIRSGQHPHSVEFSRLEATRCFMLTKAIYYTTAAIRLLILQGDHFLLFRMIQMQHITGSECLQGRDYFLILEIQWLVQQQHCLI